MTGELATRVATEAMNNGVKNRMLFGVRVAGGLSLRKDQERTSLLVHKTPMNMCSGKLRHGINSSCKQQYTSMIVHASNLFFDLSSLGTVHICILHQSYCACGLEALRDEYE